ncbi:MAG: ImmA/IrrE family metallo-endopeptidase [Acidobacteriota bacterium]|nr:ImmA/IrrE family metallo-endopeptidase [Acidobacteriota bacterium]
MILALATIKRLIPEWNERPLTAADFYRLCRRFKVKVHSIPLRVPGFYMYSRRYGAHIYVNSKLRGVAWLLAAFHELGHHLMHTPPDVTVAFFYQLRPNTKEDREADAFAYTALLPEPLLRRLLTENADELRACVEYDEDGNATESEYGLTGKIIYGRMEVLGLFRI